MIDNDSFDNDNFDCDPADCTFNRSTDSADESDFDGFGIDRKTENTDSSEATDTNDTNDANNASDTNDSSDTSNSSEATDANDTSDATDFNGDFGSSDNGMNNSDESAAPEDECCANSDDIFTQDTQDEQEAQNSGAQNSGAQNAQDGQNAESVDTADDASDITQFTGIPGYPQTPVGPWTLESDNDVQESADIGKDEKTFEHGGNCVDPSDESAATSDELYTTVTARERCALDDYEIISDVLGGEKQLVKLYSTALCESAEEPLRDIIRENLMECAKDQYATFEYMEKRGLYPVEQADEEKIIQAKQQFGPLCRA